MGRKMINKQQIQHKEAQEQSFVVELCQVPEYIKRGRLFQELCSQHEEGEEGEEQVAAHREGLDHVVMAATTSVTEGIARRVRSHKALASASASELARRNRKRSKEESDEVDQSKYSNTTTATSTPMLWSRSGYTLSFPAQYCRFDVAAALGLGLGLGLGSTAACSQVPAATIATTEAAATSPSTSTASSSSSSSSISAPAPMPVPVTYPASVLGAVGVMSTLRYWGVEDELPLELVRYLLESEELS
jgi:hypothetical protein